MDKKFLEALPPDIALIIGIIVSALGCILLVLKVLKEYQGLEKSVRITAVIFGLMITGFFSFLYAQTAFKEQADQLEKINEDLQDDLSEEKQKTVLLTAELETEKELSGRRQNIASLLAEKDVLKLRNRVIGNIEELNLIAAQNRSLFKMIMQSINSGEIISGQNGVRTFIGGSGNDNFNGSGKDDTQKINPQTAACSAEELERFGPNHPTCNPEGEKE